MLEFEPNLNPEAFRKVVRHIESTAMRPGSPFMAGLARAAARYLEFIKRRFLAASRGDGTWPDLALSTKFNRLRQSREIRTHRSQLKNANLSEVDKKKLRGKIAAASRARSRLLKDAGTKATGTPGAMGRMGNMAAMASGMKFEILRDTGLLFNSLSRGSSGHIEEQIPLGIRVGTAIKYAQYHQNGGRRLPQRMILVPPDATTAQRMEVEINAGISQMISQAGAT